MIKTEFTIEATTVGNSSTEVIATLVSLPNNGDVALVEVRGESRLDGSPTTVRVWSSTGLAASNGSNINGGWGATNTLDLGSTSLGSGPDFDTAGTDLILDVIHIGSSTYHHKVHVTVYRF